MFRACSTTDDQPWKNSRDTLDQCWRGPNAILSVLTFSLHHKSNIQYKILIWIHFKSLGFISRMQQCKTSWHIHSFSLFRPVYAVSKTFKPDGTWHGNTSRKWGWVYSLFSPRCSNVMTPANDAHDWCQGTPCFSRLLDAGPFFLPAALRRTNQ